MPLQIKARAGAALATLDLNGDEVVDYQEFRASMLGRWVGGRDHHRPDAPGIETTCAPPGTCAAIQGIPWAIRFVNLRCLPSASTWSDATCPG